MPRLAPGDAPEASAMPEPTSWGVEEVFTVGRHAILLTALCLLWTSTEAGEYNYPYHDPYLATVTTAILNADGLNPGLKREVVHVPVLLDRNRLPTLKGRGELSVALYRQPNAAPLMFMLSGIGSSPYFGAATYCARLFHDMGFHVVILPSPMTWNFALAASRSGVPGNVPEDARDLYHAMQKTLRVLKDRYGVAITVIDFMGVSLGALEGAYLSVLDAKERKIGIDRYLLANPPPDLTYALKKLDDMDALANRFGPSKSEAIMAKALAIVEPLTKDRQFDTAVFDTLVKEFSVFTTEEIQFLIAKYLQTMLPELVYVTEVIQEPGLREATKAQVRRRIRDVKSVTVMEYSEKIGVPTWRVKAGEPKADLETFTARGSLAPILAGLRDNPRVHIVHNVDDFLADPKSIEELKEVMGDRMMLYPSGGHLGNLWYPETKNYVLGLFPAARKLPPSWPSPTWSGGPRRSGTSPISDQHAATCASRPSTSSSASWDEMGAPADAASHACRPAL